MIACVSPIEYNVAETLNTIKYASRARNIKNTSKVNAVEAGWDDVEHLQNTVTKLRKQIASLDTDGSVIGAPGMAGKPLSGDMQRQSEKLIQRLAELQKEHTEVSFPTRQRWSSKKLILVSCMTDISRSVTKTCA